MDYEALAEEMLKEMFALRGVQSHEDISEAMRGEMIVLQLIFMRGAPVRPSEISAAIKRSTARVAATLNALERKGLVTREIDPSDRRQILVTLTPAGKEEMERRRRAVLRMAGGMLERLGERDARELVRLIRRLSEKVSKQGENQQGE